MENYKLIIEDLSGNWKIAELGASKPAMNYQLNNLAELKDRQVDYSRALKLPIVAINCEIFGHANEFDVITSIPYRKLNCRLFCNDSVLAGPGSYIILDRVTDGFETQILSGNADLFEIMKSIKLQNVYFDHVQHFTTAVLSTNMQSNPVFYGIAEFDSLGRSATIQGFNFYAKYALPFVKLKSLIEYLLADYVDGYTLETDVPLTFDEHALRIGNYQRDSTSFNPYNFTGLPYQSNSVQVDYQQAHWLRFRKTNMFTNHGYLPSNWSDHFKYIPPHDITFKGYALLDMNHSNYPATGIDIYINDINTYSGYINTPNKFRKYIDFSDGQLKDNISFIGMTTILANETYKISVRITNGFTDPMWINYTTETTTTDTNYTNEEIQDVPLGGFIPVAKNIGFDSVFDVVKFFFQLYGLVPYVDKENKKLHAATYNHIIALKHIAKDWTDKLVAGKNIGFSLDAYSQNNYIQLKPNAIGTIERGLIAIDNNTLKNEGVLFELPTKTVGVAKTNLQHGDVAHIDDITVDENGVPTYDTKTPVCVTYTEAGYGEDVEVAWEPGQQGTTKELPVVTKLNLTSEIVNVYYSGISQILQDTKIIDREFFLTDQDIEDYRAMKNGVPGAFIPVWIEHFGAYFYINKIKNFVSGKPTKCELVRL